MWAWATGLSTCCSQVSHGETSRVHASTQPVPRQHKDPDTESKKQVGAASTTNAGGQGGTLKPPSPSKPPPLPVGASAGLSNEMAAKSSSQDKAQANTDVETASMVSSRSARSIRSAATTSSICSEYIEERLRGKLREASRIQQSMKKFVKGMVRGRHMGALSLDGQLRTCTCSLDKRLRYFVIELKGVSRKIPLTSISEVYQGKEPEDIETPLDELCSTLVLEQGECITFRFSSETEREDFAICLQMLVDGQR